MTGKLIQTALILIALLLFSCSWITDFAVLNRSDAPIEIKYKFKHQVKQDGQIRCTEIEIFGGPERPKNANYKGSRTLWEKVPADEYTLSVNQCEVLILLDPNEIIKIGSIGTYTGHKGWRHEYFGVAQLSINTKNGMITYSDFELVRQFKKKSDQLYVLEYK